MNTYDNPIYVTYAVAAGGLSGGAATLKRFIGPVGRTGHVRALTYIVTTSVTVAAALVTIDTSGTAGAYGSVSIPVSSANAGGSATKANLAAAADIPADTVISIKTNGASTAGAADITLAVGWF
jgi:hypothetical protein